MSALLCLFFFVDRTRCVQFFFLFFSSHAHLPHHGMASSLVLLFVLLLLTSAAVVVSGGLLRKTCSPPCLFDSARDCSGYRARREQKYFFTLPLTYRDKGQEDHDNHVTSDLCSFRHRGHYDQWSRRRHHFHHTLGGKLPPHRGLGLYPQRECTLAQCFTHSKLPCNGVGAHGKR